MLYIVHLHRFFKPGLVFYLYFSLTRNDIKAIQLKIQAQHGKLMDAAVSSLGRTNENPIWWHNFSITKINITIPGNKWQIIRYIFGISTEILVYYVTNNSQGQHIFCSSAHSVIVHIFYFSSCCLLVLFRQKKNIIQTLNPRNATLRRWHSISNTNLTGGFREFYNNLSMMLLSPFDNDTCTT